MKIGNSCKIPGHYKKITLKNTLIRHLANLLGSYCHNVLPYLQLFPELDMSILAGGDDKICLGNTNMRHNISVHKTLLIVLSAW